jgi:hypothetical protein
LPVYAVDENAEDTDFYGLKLMMNKWLRLFMRRMEHG